MIRHFVGPDAHVILVVTKSDELAVSLKRIDVKEVSEQIFFNKSSVRLVPEFSATEKSYESAVENLRQEIHDVLELVELPRVSRQFVALKEHLESEMEGRAFVALEEYRQWCLDLGIPQESDQDAYLRTLHHFGSAFFFGLLELDRKLSGQPHGLPSGQRRLLKAKRPPVLNRWLINPRWLKWPLYRLIRESERQQWLSVDEIRSEAQQETPHFVLNDRGAAEDIIVGVLELTELCIYDQKPGDYFFPRGLPREGAQFLTGWDKASRYEIRWEWDFFPETVIHRFIVRAHENGEISVRTQWRTGVVLELGDTMVAIQGESEHGLVKIWLKKRPDNAERPTRGDRDVLDQIRHHLRELVGREPGEETRTWEEAETGATDADRVNKSTAQKKPEATDRETETSVISRGHLSQYAKEAYEMYEAAASAIGEPNDSEAYAWIKARIDDGEFEYDLKGFETWSRYVREARKHYGASKNTPRHGRSGRSIVRSDEI